MTPQTPAGRAARNANGDWTYFDGDQLWIVAAVAGDAIEREAAAAERERAVLPECPACDDSWASHVAGMDGHIEQAAEAADREAAGNAGPTATGFAASGFATSAAADNDRLRAALTALVDALTKPLPDEVAERLNGQNRAWVDWYPSSSIVNSPDGPDTGSVIIALIFTATEQARAALAAGEGK